MKISVKAKPNSKTESVKKIDEENFVICVHEPAKEGKANRAVIKALAEHFGVSTSRITLISGQTSKQKIFDIS
ncbi:MAG: DUF167 domain-containing protein [Patescibacteria group bacterium]